MTKRMPPSCFGFWSVTTEGDCEGRTTANLGVHEGYLDEVALRLAPKCYYALSMHWVDPKSLAQMLPMSTTVNVALGIESGTWDMKPDERVEAFRALLLGRDVSVEAGQYFASVTLHAGSDAVSRAKKEIEARRQLALAKLSEEDKKALGLK